MILIPVVPIGNSVVEFKELKGEAVSTVPQNSNTYKEKKKRLCAFKFSIKPYAYVLNFSMFVNYLQNRNISSVSQSWCSVTE